MKTVELILKRKSANIISVDPGSSVFDALQLMMEQNVSAVLILENGMLAGIFTERDYARKIILKGKSSKETSIKEVMTANPVTISSSEQIDNCLQLVTERRFRHLPVVDEGKIIGMISIGDLVKFVMDDQKQTISELENYISS